MFLGAWCSTVFSLNNRMKRALKTTDRTTLNSTCAPLVATEYRISAMSHPSSLRCFHDYFAFYARVAKKEVGFVLNLYEAILTLQIHYQLSKCGSNSAAVYIGQGGWRSLNARRWSLSL